MAAITLNLDDQASAMIEDWVREGLYATPEEVVEAGIAFVREQVMDSDLTPQDIAAIEEGQADIAAGRVVDAETVFAELRAHFQAMADRR